MLRDEGGRSKFLRNLSIYEDIRTHFLKRATLRFEEPLPSEQEVHLTRWYLSTKLQGVRTQKTTINNIAQIPCLFMNSTEGELVYH
jgi:hypothetical protein